MLEEILVFTLPLVVTLVLWVLLRKTESERKKKVYKIIAVAYFVIATLRLFMADSFINIINDAEYIAYEISKGANPVDVNIFGSILRLFYQISWTVLPITAFLPSRVMKNIAIFFCLPMLILATIYYNDVFMKYFLDVRATGNKFSPFIRNAQFMLELMFGYLLVYNLLVIDRHKLKLDWKEWGMTLAALPFLIILLSPIYVPQSLFGTTDLHMAKFKPTSLAWQSAVILVPFLIYYAFRFKDRDTRYLVCVIMAMALFYEYNMLYLTRTGWDRFPLQLCNIAAYVIIAAVVFKSNKLFYFGFIMNATGGIIALTIPESTEALLSFYLLHFVYEHTLVVVVPIILASLRIFKRPDQEAFKSAIGGYVIYFFIVWLFGTIMNGIGESVSYFYIFDDTVAQVFPFLRTLYNFRFNIGSFTIIPLYQLAVFLLFLSACLLFYKVTEYFFKVADDHFELRRIAIRRWEKRTGKKSRKLIDYVD